MNVPGKTEDRSAMSGPEWLQALFQTIDSKNASGFVSFLTDDAEFRYGGAPAVVGRSAIEETVVGFFRSVKRLRHRISDTWVHASAVICRGDVTYTRLDDSEITIPFVNILGLNGGHHISRYQIYIDTAPLLAAPR